MEVSLGENSGKKVTFACDEAMNMHIALLGESGCGKSTKARGIMQDIVRQGGKVVAFDLHHVLSDDQIFESSRDEFFSCVHNIDVYQNGISCDLFSPMQYADGTYEKQIDTVGAVTDIFARKLNLGSRQRAVLRNAINDMNKHGLYERDGIAALERVLRIMDSKVAETVIDRMDMILQHNLLRFGKWTVRDEKINIFRLSKFDSETQEVAAEIILSYIWRREMTRGGDGNGIFIVVDECQNLSSGRNSILSRILSEGRKFNVNLLLATQQLMQGHPSVVQQRMAQCGLCLYFRPGAGQIRTVAKMIDPNGIREWSSVLHSLSIGEFIAVGALKIDGYSIDHPLKITSFEEQSDMKKKESPKRNTCRVRRNVFAEVEGFGF